MYPIDLFYNRSVLRDLSANVEVFDLFDYNRKYPLVNLSIASARLYIRGIILGKAIELDIKYNKFLI